MGGTAMINKLPDLGPALGANVPRQLEAVFEAMSDGVWVCDATPRLLWINSACEQLNDIRREEVCGKTVAELLGMGNFDHDVTRRVLREQHPVAINQKVKTGRTLLVNGVPVFDDDGEIAYVVGTERDLTELNVLRSELDRSHEISRRINSELLALKMKELKLTEIVAESEPMERVLDTALRVAAFDTTVLLTGPSGTGKSLIARVVHQSSNRRERPFLSLNCGAIPASLLEAELFGYADGAFTGAQRGGKPGLLEAAHGGTVFLDEIDAFQPDLQVKLLTVLDTQAFIRVGGTRVQHVDVRLIAATNRDLGALVEAGTFREDLWFRLNVVPIALPPLRERPADIPALADAMLKRLGERYGIARSLSPQAMDVLCRYEFPGNVRELQNILERSFVFSHAETIDFADLPAEVRAAFPRPGEAPAESLEQALVQVEREWLARACRRHRRQVDVAAELGVSQPTVARLLKKHGLKLGVGAPIRS
jgi:PAS domain S-box-containing protein